jgi:DNA-binding PadR family transcriptional regulator
MNTDSDLTRAVVEPLVLRLVSEKAMYGYEIIKVVHQRTNGAFEWKEGTLYPVLHRLEGSGLIKSEWSIADSGRNRKYYSITRKGTALLKDKVSEWATFSAAVQAVLSPAPQGLPA